MDVDDICEKATNRPIDIDGVELAATRADDAKQAVVDFHTALGYAVNFHCLVERMG